MNVLLTSLALFVVLNAIVVWTSKAAPTRDGFFVADRKSGMWPTAFSISATFLYAFGCIFASVFAYAKGWAGVTWLMIPNLIAVASVGFVGYNLLKDDTLKKGFNFTDVIKNKYDNKVLTWFFTIMYQCRVRHNREPHRRWHRGQLSGTRPELHLSPDSDFCGCTDLYHIGRTESKYQNRHGADGFITVGCRGGNIDCGGQCWWTRNSDVQLDRR